MILEWNKQATVNAAMTSHFGWLTEGTPLTDEHINTSI
jgi:hypothetical protein